MQIEINEIEKIAETLSSLVVYAYECKIKQFNRKVFQTFFVIMRMKSAIFRIVSKSPPPSSTFLDFQGGGIGRFRNFSAQSSFGINEEKDSLW